MNQYMTIYKYKSHRGAPLGIILRSLLLALLMTAGANEVWGAFTEGLYYIKSNANTDYYLCPSIGCYYGNNVDQPHLTTFKTNGDQYSIWKIVPTGEEDTYYIIHYKTGRYLKSNENIKSSDGKNNRKAVHLEVKPETLTDDFMFLIKNTSSPYQIYPKVYYTDASGMSFNPTSEHKDWYAPEDGGTGVRGMIGLYSKGDNFSKWQIIPVASASTPCATPIIKYDGDNINISYPYSDETGITIYYTTDDTDPATSGTRSSYSSPISASGVVKVRAIATKTDYVNSDEAVLWGSARPFLIQSKECADYYLVPAGNGTNVNTSSLPGTSMQWKLQNAGASTGGVPYYYIVNSNEKKISYNSSNNTIPLNSESADANKFCVFENGYGTGNFFLIPVSQTNRVLYKNKGNVEADNCKAELNKKWDTNLDQWNLIACNETADQKNLFSTAPFSVSDDDETHFYHIASVGQDGYFIVPPSDPDGSATTSNTGYNDTPWLFKVATSDNWLTYYYIINAASGKYMYFKPNNNQTGDQENVISLKDISEMNAENEEKFQFIMVRSTTTGACYIVPKGYSYADASHRNFYNNKYFGLWANESGPLKSTWSRISTGNHVKWTFEETTITNLYFGPVFSEDEGLIQITVPTIATKICYTTDGSTPTAATETVFTDATELQASSQYLIKAIAVQKNNTSVVSNVVTLYNKPDITLSQDTYTYDRTAHEPTVSKVAITINETEYAAATTPTPTYAVDSYTNNTNAGTATVSITDNDPSDNIFFANATTTFTITPVSLTIVADATSKGYGDSDPALTYTPTGIAAGDDVADVLTGVLAREAGENVGTYAISQGTLASASTNYTIGTFTPANFTITQKSIGNGTIPAAGITCDITKNNDDSFTVTVNNNGNAMTVGTLGDDYDYSLSTTGDASTKYYEVEATGANNYTGSFKVKFANAPFGTHDDTNYSATFITDATGDEDFATPTGMTACIITGVDVATGVVTVETLDYIPENVPVVLLSDHAATGFFIQPRVGGSDITSSQVSSNLLAVARGDDAARTFAVAEIYLLYKDEFVLNTAGTLPAERVYLPVAAIGGAPAKLGIDWDCITGITTPVDPSATTVPVGFANGIWYTLDGRRVSGKPTQRGLYISNGQKVVVK